MSYPLYQEALLKRLVEHSPRWVDLSLLAIPKMLPLLATVRGRLPLLRRLWIEWDSGSDSGSDSDPGASDAEDIECFDEAPSLRDVGLLVEYHHISIPIPMAQLTRYELNGDWNTHVQNLRLAANLVEAHIFVDSGSRTVAGGAIELPHIRRLYVSDSDILECLRCPALEDLSFYLDESERPEQHFESILLRSACTLRRLCLIGKPIADTIIAILRNNPSLNEIAIILSRKGSEEEANTLISNLAGTPHVAPQLSSIFFGCKLGISLDYALYAHMLESRRDPEGRALLRAGLLIDSETEPTPEVLRRFDLVRRDGLEFTWLNGLEAWFTMSAWTFCTQWSQVR